MVYVFFEFLVLTCGFKGLVHDSFFVELKFLVVGINVLILSCNLHLNTFHISSVLSVCCNIKSLYLIDF